MRIIRYIGVIRLISIYLKRAAIRIICGNFHQDSVNSEGLFCVATDRRTEKKIDYPNDTESEYIYIIVAEQTSTKT